MKDIASVLMTIIPKETEVLRRRYQILNTIQLFQPIGRRSLSQRLNISEKLIRTDSEFLKAEGFIEVNAIGMEISQKGIEILDDLRETMKALQGLNSIQEKVKEILPCKDLVIVPGDADQSEETRKSIAKTASEVLINHIEKGSIIALTGGSSVHNVIQAIKPTNLEHMDVTVVPARGSLGNNVEYQSNTLVSMLAKKINAGYKLLNIPDNLSPKAFESVKEEPDIQNTLDIISKANILVYGIGNVFEMAKRRNLDEKTIKYLEEQGAVSEVLGNYFNAQGDVVYTSTSIGITIDEMKNLNYPIAVAGGARKAEAILSVKNYILKGCLIMDEGAANQLINMSATI